MTAAMEKPTLYRAADDDPERAVLLGVRCRCGHVAFPFQRFGCVVCGRHDGDLELQELTGAGMLLASASVYVHAGDFPAVPFRLATVRLEEGPVIRALVAPDAPDARLSVGARTIAVLRPGADGDQGLRIAPAAQGRDDA